MKNFLYRIPTTILANFWDEVNSTIGVSNTPQSVETLVTRAAGWVNFAASLAGVVAACFVIAGAYMKMTAFGDKDKAAGGQNTATAGLVGLVIIILGRVFIGFVFALVTKVW